MKMGQVAGLGGLSLGVFLLLFRTIKLPTATRRHVTLFMWLLWSFCILGVIAYLIGEQMKNGVTLAQTIAQRGPDNIATPAKDTIARFTEPLIPITYNNANAGFISFLQQNNGKTIYISSSFDCSRSTTENEEVFQSFLPIFPESFDEYEDFTFKGPVPLDGRLHLDLIELHLLNNRELPLSTGGTGVVMYPLKGYFDVTVLYRSGPSRVYILTEIQRNISESI